MTAKPYDTTLKALVETEPESWPAFLGRPTGPTAVIDSDIATVSGAADKVLRVAATIPYLLHLEFVSGHDGATGRVPGRDTHRAEAGRDRDRQRFLAPFGRFEGARDR